MNKDPLFTSAEWRKISSEAKDFCETCLQKQAKDRPTIEQLFSHPWIEKMVKGPVVDKEK